ncbi:MAS protein, partial [Galbula dea]|nr:MAS protein [Galbula dea]
ETTTADLSLSYTASDYVSFGEGIKYNCSRVSGELMIFVDVYVGISLCGLVGNGVIMWFLVFHMKQNPFTIYILNLTAADFSLLLLFFLLLLGVYCLTAFCLYIFLPFYQGFAFVVEFLCHFFELIRLGLLTAISVEHCISVL